jgi:diadenosine tetraphosphate (Ap4A) HIT family hydrolase
MVCPFCKINELRNRIIKEKKYVFVTLSNPRLMSGHLLVIPKRHVEKLSELSEEERKELFDTAIEFQDKITSSISAGCDLSQHFRPFLPESDLKVDHTHIHLKPRNFEDEVFHKCNRFEVEMFKPLADGEVNEIDRKLKSE